MLFRSIFLCSPKIFSYIEEVEKEGKTEFADCIAKAAKNRDAEVFDIGEIESYDSGMRKDVKHWWIDVDTDEDLRKAESMLLATLKKTSDGPISRYLNRPISTRISKYLAKTNVTPNVISFSSFILCCIGAFFFFLGEYRYLLLGATLAQVASIIDGCDGEIARLKFQEMEFGGWFDAVLDRYADAFLLFGLTYYVYSLSGNILYLLIGFLAIIGTFMNSYTADKYDSLMKKKIGSKGHYFRLGRDVRIFTIFLLVILNLPFLAIFLIALLMNTENIRRIVVLYKSG